MENDGSGDIIKAEPMDLNDDDKASSDTAETVENGDKGHIPFPSGKVVQVTNVSPGATLQQLATLFGFIGTVTDIRLYPSDETDTVQVKVCYIKYENNEQCGVAQHLTNTVFIDKALIVVPISKEEIPEESECQHLIKSINAYATMSTTGYLPTGFPSQEEGDGGIPGLPPPPVITHSTDPVEIEEIKRTIFVTNIDPSVTSEQLMAFFSGVGEIKYMRLCKPEGNKYAFIEFSGQESVPTALQYNGVIFGGQCLKVDHAKSPIVKPESERIASGRNLNRSSRDVVKRPSSVNLRRSRSRSISRRRSRSRGRASKDRDRPRRSRSRSKSKRRKSRSRSPRRRRTPTRSPVRRRSRSRSKSRRQRSRSRTRSPPRRRSRSRSRERRRKRRSISRSKSRSKSPRRKRKSKSRSRSPRRKSKRSASKSPDRSKKKRSDDKDKKKEKKEKESKEEKKEKDKDKDKEKTATEPKDLKSLLDKVYTYEEEKEKKKSSKEKDKEKEKEVPAADKEIDWKDI